MIWQRSPLYQIFLLIFCEINKLQASHTAKWNRSYGKDGQRDYNQGIFKLKGLSPSKGWVIGEPDFWDEIFGKWVWSEEILLFT